MESTNTWKFFSFHPGRLAKSRTNNSESWVSSASSSHGMNSSRAARRIFQFASLRSAAIWAGTMSEAIASASSAEYLNFRASPGTAGGVPFGGGFAAAAAAAAEGGFFAGAAAGGPEVPGGFFVCDEDISMDNAALSMFTY